MPKVHVVAESSAPADRVLAAARDFSARRASLWRDVYVEHLEVHDSGETWAEVTEGNPWPIGFVWERLRYDWSEPGAVKGRVIESNIFKPGSTWEIHATPLDGGGSRPDLRGPPSAWRQGMAARAFVPDRVGAPGRSRLPAPLPCGGRGRPGGGRWEAQAGSSTVAMDARASSKLSRLS